MRRDRYIGGKEWRRIYKTPSKSDAQIKAKEERAKGKRVRVLRDNYSELRMRRGYGGYRCVTEGWGVFEPVALGGKG